MGHVLGPDPCKVTVIVDMPNPTDVTSTMKFLGFVNYLARFVPNLTTIGRQIQELVNSERAVELMFREHEAAIKRVTVIISSFPVPISFVATKQLVVQSDASKEGLEAALMQDGWPLAHANWSLIPSEQNYHQIKKELLNVHFAIECSH